MLYVTRSLCKTPMELWFSHRRTVREDEPKNAEEAADTLRRKASSDIRVPSGAVLHPMNKLVIANLLHRPLRSLISITAIAIEVVMILSIVAIFMGMLDSQKERTNGIGADVVVMPSNASMMSGVGGAPMPAKLAGFLAESAPCNRGSAGDY